MVGLAKMGGWCGEHGPEPWAVEVSAMRALKALRFQDMCTGSVGKDGE